MSAGEVSNSFPCMKGVRQGCPLSPLLFGLFVNDIIEFLQLNDSGFIPVMATNLRALLFADDLELFAESSSRLQCSMSKKINISKSKGFFFKNKRSAGIFLLY